jgi:hypothetical protein
MSMVLVVLLSHSLVSGSVHRLLQYKFVLVHIYEPVPAPAWIKSGHVLFAITDNKIEFLGVQKVSTDPRRSLRGILLTSFSLSLPLNRKP